MVRLALRGVLGVADHAVLADLLAEQGEVFAALHQWERHTNVGISADGAQLADLRLGGFVSAAAEEMRELAVADEAPAGPGAPADEQADDGAGQHEDPDPLAWEFTPDSEDDQRSAADALSLLYRLAREEAR